MKFELNGKKYKSVDFTHNCDGCAFKKDNINCVDVPFDCYKYHIIYVEDI